MPNKPKLELTWIGKEHRPRLEPRILLADQALSYHAAHRVKQGPEGYPQISEQISRQIAGQNTNNLSADLESDDVTQNMSGESAFQSARKSADKTPAPVGDLFDNMLIQGDNLLALKALEAEYSGKVKCVFIDPPYNTGSAFAHYDDGVEHSLWLSLMRDRLEIIRKLLRDDGSLWITIDDNEAHYLKVLCDEVFGRGNFVANVVWQSKDTPGNNASGIAQTHNHILAYRKSEIFTPNLLPRNEQQLSTYSNPDNDNRGSWLSTPLTRVEYRERDYYAITRPDGKMIFPPKGSSWRRPKATMEWLEQDKRIWWGKKGNAEFPMEKKFLSEVKEGVVNQTWWPYDFAGSTRNASAEMKSIFEGDKSFDTPKPEKLSFRILQLATNPGDLVLDSFAGSGTTGAVAHKMGRRWIMVELGDHAVTHIVPRLRKVIDGADAGGVTAAVGWAGGGGFRFYRLAPSLLEQDRWGNWVINKQYNAAMLAEALCKLEGFTYAPSDTRYWQHGHSSERDFIYVTTASLSHEQLAQLSDEVGSERTLLVLCAAFRGSGEYGNLTVKRIPRQVLSRCEWGHDDYSLQVENLPKAPGKVTQETLF